MHQSRLRSWVRPPVYSPSPTLDVGLFFSFLSYYFYQLISSCTARWYCVHLPSAFLSGTLIHAVQRFFPSVHYPLPLSPLIAKLSARNWCSGSPLEVDKNVPTVPSNLVQALVIVPILNGLVHSLVKSNLGGKTGSSFEQSLMSKVVTRFCR